MVNDGILKNTYKHNSMILVVLLCLLTVMLKLPNVFWWVDTMEWKFHVLPIVWFAITFLVVFILPNIHPIIRLSKQDNIYFDSLIYAIILISIQYLVGIIIGKLGKTPYDLSPKGIWSNIITVLLPFIAIECIRGYVLNSYCRKKNVTLFIFITLLITFTNCNLQKITALKNLEEITIYIAQVLGPELCKNIILSYLALYGGPIASICYGGLLLIFHWFFPILPVLNWLAQGVIGIVVPICECMFITNKYDEQYVSKRKAKMCMKDTLSWAFTLSFSVVIIWFVVGVFPIFPSVIVTGSMEPLIYPGDVILVKQFYSEEEIKALQAGDIIYFERDDIVIVHRITKVISEKNGKYSFQTKGDNNSTEDTRLVLPEEVIGEYVVAIPKVGYPTLLFKTNYLKEREDVEN